MTIVELREKRAKLWATMEGFLDTHRDRKGILSAEDDAIYNKMVDDMDRMGKEIARLEKLEALDVEMSRATSKPLTSAPVNSYLEHDWPFIAPAGQRGHASGQRVLRVEWCAVKANCS